MKTIEIPSLSGRATIELRLRTCNYRQNNARAVWLECTDGEPYCDVSVYAYDETHDYSASLAGCDPEAFWLKHWDFPALPEILLEAGLIVPLPIPSVSLGYVRGVKAYKLTEKGEAIAEPMEDPHQ